MAENYGILTENKINEIKKAGTHPTLLLHVCCAPCSSYVLEYLSHVFDITLFFYNPNIFPEGEYKFRLSELERFTSEAGYTDMRIISPVYNPTEFFEAVRGMESLAEGGERCRICYNLRLKRTAEEAASGKYDYFTTTLSISPYKNSEWLNEIGNQLANEYGLSYLYSDFKKKNGYKRSIELSTKYGLYRQNYCGCIYSKKESENKRLKS